jgi:type III secretory pathway component EscR
MDKLIEISLSILLFGCLFDFPYNYYQLVRFAAMVGFTYLAYSAIEKSNKNEVFVYIALGILFQPFIKIALGRTIWNVVDVLVGVGLLLSLAVAKKVKKKTNDNNSNENVMVNDSGKQSETKSEIKTAMTTKNKWLYPTDNLGKLEKGVEFESKIYLRDKKDTNSQDFTIL